jgi:hypothetical protein
MWGPINRVQLTAVRQALLITEFHLEQLTYNYHHNKAVPLHANQAQMGNGNIALHMLDPSARMVGGGCQRHASAALPTGRRPGTPCTEGWVGLEVSLDGSGKPRLLRGSRSGPSSP